MQPVLGNIKQILAALQQFCLFMDNALHMHACLASQSDESVFRISMSLLRVEPRCTARQSIQFKSEFQSESKLLYLLFQGHPATQSPVEGVNQGPGRNSPMPDLLAAGGMPLGLGVQPGGPLGPMSPSMAARALDKPAPALPPEGNSSSSNLPE